MTAAITQNCSATEKEVTHWFFEDYLPTWVSTGANGGDADFISTYWGSPLHVCSDAVQEHKLHAEDVVHFLDQMQKRLQKSGYSATKVLDRRIKVYNAHGAGIEVIWSRRRADNTHARLRGQRYPCPPKSGGFASKPFHG